MGSGVQEKIVAWPAGERVVSAAVADAIVAANTLSIGLAEQLNGFRIPRLPEEKRVQLSSACFHIALEHQQSLNTLVVQGQYGSAVALIRPAVEACLRGLWLMLIASSDQLDAVGRDERNAFPTFQMIVRAIESSSGIKGTPTADVLGGEPWSRLCSYTHTGYQQIGARLTANGLGAAYHDDELRSALAVASVSAVISAASLASLGGDDSLAATIMGRLAIIDGPDERPS